MLDSPTHDFTEVLCVTISMQRLLSLLAEVGEIPTAGSRRTWTSRRRCGPGWHAEGAEGRLTRRVPDPPPGGAEGRLEAAPREHPTPQNLRGSLSAAGRSRPRALQGRGGEDGEEGGKGGAAHEAAPEKLRAACSIHRDDALSSHHITSAAPAPSRPLLRRAPGPHRAGRGVLLLLRCRAPSITFLRMSSRISPTSAAPCAALTALTEPAVGSPLPAHRQKDGGRAPR